MVLENEQTHYELEQKYGGRWETFLNRERYNPYKHDDFYSRAMFPTKAHAQEEIDVLVRFGRYFKSDLRIVSVKEIRTVIE